MLRRDYLVAHHGRERPEPQLVKKHEEAQRKEADPLPRRLTEPKQPNAAGMASVVQPKRRHADGHAKRRRQEHRPPPDPVGAKAHADHAHRALAPYFTNAQVDGQRLVRCLVRQLSAATGALDELGRRVRLGDLGSGSMYASNGRHRGQ